MRLLLQAFILQRYWLLSFSFPGNDVKHQPSLRCFKLFAFRSGIVMVWSLELNTRRLNNKQYIHSWLSHNISTLVRDKYNIIVLIEYQFVLHFITLKVIDNLFLIPFSIYHGLGHPYHIAVAITAATTSSRWSLTTMSSVLPSVDYKFVLPLGSIVYAP